MPPLVVVSLTVPVSAIGDGAELYRLVVADADGAVETTRRGLQRHRIRAVGDEDVLSAQTQVLRGGGHMAPRRANVGGALQGNGTASVGLEVAARPLRDGAGGDGDVVCRDATGGGKRPAAEDGVPGDAGGLVPKEVTSVMALPLPAWTQSEDASMVRHCYPW